MDYRVTNEMDLPTAVCMYMNYYNTLEDGEWTEKTAYKRIIGVKLERQVKAQGASMV